MSEAELRQARIKMRLHQAIMLADRARATCSKTVRRVRKAPPV